MREEGYLALAQDTPLQPRPITAEDRIITYESFRRSPRLKVRTGESLDQGHLPLVKSPAELLQDHEFLSGQSHSSRATQAETPDRYRITRLALLEEKNLCYTQRVLIGGALF